MRGFGREKKKFREQGHGPYTNGRRGRGGDISVGKDWNGTVGSNPKKTERATEDTKANEGPRENSTEERNKAL